MPVTAYRNALHRAKRGSNRCRGCIGSEVLCFAKTPKNSSLARACRHVVTPSFALFNGAREQPVFWFIHRSSRRRRRRKLSHKICSCSYVFALLCWVWEDRSIPMMMMMLVVVVAGHGLLSWTEMLCASAPSIVRLLGLDPLSNAAGNVFIHSAFM